MVVCGFVVANDAIAGEALQRCIGVLAHRGPDAARFWSDGRVHLLHNRLSIIDPTARADQPWVDRRTGNVIVFNGEIYNYQELREKYRDLSWETASDTEVIVKLYQALGDRFVEALNGIFAFVIYDRERAKLIACRDRFGVKPLVWSCQEGALMLASEAKALLPFVETGFDVQSISAYLQDGLLCHSQRTFFEGIVSIPPACVMEFDIQSGRSRSRCYWDLPQYGAASGEQDGLEEQVFELLNDSVRLNRVSDVEVGMSLSSGTDSLLLFELLRKPADQTLAVFSFGFQEPQYDEVRRIRETVDLSGVEFLPTFLTREVFLATLEEAIYYFESPLGGVGTLSAYEMCKQVRRRGIKVVVAGEGADEVFGGYQYYYGAYFHELQGRSPSLAQACVRDYARSEGICASEAARRLQALADQVRGTAVLAPDGSTARRCHPGEALQGAGVDGQSLIRPVGTLVDAMNEDLRRKKLPKLLHFQDRAGMASGVEVRVPYLDHRLVESVRRLPGELLIRRGRNKYLIRRFLERYFGRKAVPEKRYVVTPQREWLKDERTYRQIRELLVEGVAAKEAFVDVAGFLADYDGYRRSPEPGNSFFVWKVLNLELLLRTFEPLVRKRAFHREAV